MPTLLETADGKFIEGGEKELDRLFDGLKAASEPRLLLHVHGGLVHSSVARSEAERLDGPAAYGALREAGWHTGYLIWRTGLLESVRINLHELAGDGLFSAVKAVVRRWVASKALDKVGGLEDALVSTSASLEQIETTFREAEFRPPSEIEANLSASDRAIIDGEADPGPGNELYDALAADPLLQQLSQNAELSLIRRESLTASLHAVDESALRMLDHLDEEVRIELTERQQQANLVAAAPFLGPVFWRAAKAGYRAIRRALKGRDHGFLATIVEEVARALYLDLIGSGVWGGMKKDASEHFDQTGAGSAFLDKLRELAKSTNGPVRLLFVGHSAGSIVACDLLKAAGDMPDNLVIDFVLLAPAVRLDKAASALGAAESQLDNIRIFTMHDDRERTDALDNVLPVSIYPRSLLYLISGVLENDDDTDGYPDAPLLGLHRHIVGLPDERLTKKERRSRDTIRAFLSGGNSRIVYSDSSAGDGLNTDARTHGTFDNDPDTLASIRHIALKGY